MNQSAIQQFRRCISSLAGLVALGASVATAEAQPAASSVCLADGSAALQHFRGCTDIIGDLRIERSTAETLDDLSALRRVSGTLLLAENPRLTSLRGLENLRSAGGLVVRQNPLLSSIDDLEHLEHVAHIEITQNRALDVLEGPNSLAHVDELIVRDNGLVRLGGFRNLTSAGSVVIADNTRLIYAPGLARVVTVDNLTLSHNPRLAPASGLFGSLARVRGEFSMSRCPGLRKSDVLGNG